MSQPSTPLLSVVVPIYNVGSYLRPCLDSLLEQKLGDIEIVCVDDGSTDGSGEIADKYAAKESRIRVLHVENGGLGRARNIGAEAARGKYLAFVDSDDRVTVDGYELMCKSLERSNSDMATGHVNRFTDTRSWRSGLHAMAIKRGARGTHISKMTSLVNDTTAWNKVFRRSFWDEHEFRFPEGVLYEDIPVTIPAHVLAKQVDVIPRAVYEWRERGDGSMSITQRRAEFKNLHDRLSAVEYASDFLAQHADERVIHAHDLKVLTVDIPLYFDVLDVADDEYREMFKTHMRQYLEHVDPVIYRQLPVWDRVGYELLARGRLEEAVQLLQERKANRRAFEVKRRGLNLYAQLPYLRDRAVGVPDAAYAVTRQLPVRSAAETVEIRNGVLVIRGFALIDKVALNHPWSAFRYVAVRNHATGHRIIRPVRPVRRPDITGEHGLASAGYDWAGFEAHIPLRRLKAGADGDPALYEVQIKIATPAARRGVGLQAASTATFMNPRYVAPDGTHVAVHGGIVRVAVTRNAPLAHRVSIDAAAGLLRCTLQLLQPADDATRMVWHSERDEAPDVSSVLRRDETDPSLYHAEFPLTDFHMLELGTERRIWRAVIDRADAAAAAHVNEDGLAPTERSVAAHPLFEPQLLEVPERHREFSVHAGAAGRLELIDRRTQVRVERFDWQDGELQLQLSAPQDLADTEAAVHVSLRHPDGLDVLARVTEKVGSSLIAKIPIVDLASTQSIQPGTWTLQVREGDFAHDRFLIIDVDQQCSEQDNVVFGNDHVSARVFAGGNRLQVRVRSGREADRGAYNQARLRSGSYAAARRQALQDVVLFQAWSGKQYSCNPRAIYEELRRQDRNIRCLWVRRNTSVEVPEGVPSVLLWSREYYEALATARHVIANDAMPTYYEKRAGSSYLQTWHGTPLKRIGFDIENIQFGNSRYLEDFAVEVTKWDRLISPNAYSSEVFRRAFNYSGEILETGYPRNDIFYAPDVQERALAVRKRLGLSPTQRVLLWAPTWRDDQRDRRGRYELPLPFDLATWDYILGPDDVLLFRGHQLVQQTVGSKLAGLRAVRNVTTYPDIQDLYLVADLLITDYSSVMFDFANTRRPMIFYAWDLEVYRDNLRGFYFDFEAEAPGPLVTDLAGLHDAIAGNADTEGAKVRYDRFVERYCGLEDGHASERVLRALFDR